MKTLQDLPVELKMHIARYLTPGERRDFREADLSVAKHIPAGGEVDESIVAHAASAATSPGLGRMGMDEGFLDPCLQDDFTGRRFIAPAFIKLDPAHRMGSAQYNEAFLKPIPAFRKAAVAFAEIPRLAEHLVAAGPKGIATQTELNYITAHWTRYRAEVGLLFYFPSTSLYEFYTQEKELLRSWTSEILGNRDRPLRTLVAQENWSPSDNFKQAVAGHLENFIYKVELKNCIGRDFRLERKIGLVASTGDAEHEALHAGLILGLIARAHLIHLTYLLFAPRVLEVAAHLEGSILTDIHDFTPDARRDFNFIDEVLAKIEGLRVARSAIRRRETPSASEDAQDLVARDQKADTRPQARTLTDLKALFANVFVAAMHLENVR